MTFFFKVAFSSSDPKSQQYTKIQNVCDVDIITSTHLHHVHVAQKVNIRTVIKVIHSVY